MRNEQMHGIQNLGQEEWEGEEKRRRRRMEWKRKKEQWRDVISLRVLWIRVSLVEIRCVIRDDSFSHCFSRSLWVGLVAIWVSGWLSIV